MDVALAGRRAELLEEVAHEIRAQGARGVALPVDLSVAEERRGLLERVEASLGPLSILVNNAATLAGGDLALVGPEEIEMAIATNLTAPIELTRLALPDLRRRQGAVVLIASGASLVPLPSATIYSATKAAVRAFGESLRYELKPQGVRLLVVYPPPTDTAMVRGMAQAAGLPDFPRSRPEAVGERIVSALWRGRREIYFPSGERALALAYRVAPWAVRRLLQSQQKRFAKMMAVGRKEGAK